MTSTSSSSSPSCKISEQHHNSHPWSSSFPLTSSSDSKKLELLVCQMMKCRLNVPFLTGQADASGPTLECMTQIQAESNCASNCSVEYIHCQIRPTDVCCACIVSCIPHRTVLQSTHWEGSICYQKKVLLTRRPPACLADLHSMLDSFLRTILCTCLCYVNPHVSTDQRCTLYVGTPSLSLRSLDMQPHES